uniref:Aminopeptidase n=1 Tax=Ditylenchus dipsaci TaxID=166011 RepID=A0A915EAP1_9BILA
MDMIGFKGYGYDWVGAMENYGLVTFKEDYLVYDSGIHTQADKQLVSKTIAHEFAHQWLGDLVTMKWWNDLSMIEGAASLLTYPALGVSLNYTDQQLVNILILLNGPEDYSSLFTGISFGKSATVFRMFERVLGTDTFYKGLQIDLKRHKYGNTEFKDLLKALDEAKQRSGDGDKMPYDVVQFAEGWINQANHPVVSVKRISSTTVQLSQQRFILDYEINENSVKSVWQIPIWYQVNGIEKEVVWLTSQQPIYLNVDSTDLLVVNADCIGFYHVLYDQSLITSIKESLASDISSIPTLTRAYILEDLFKLAEAGYSTYASVFDFTSYLANETETYPWTVLSNNFQRIQQYYKDQPESQIVDDYLNYLFNLRSKKENLKISKGNYFTDEPNLCNLAPPILPKQVVNAPSKTKVPEELRTSVYCSGVQLGSSDNFDYVMDMVKKETKDTVEHNRLLFALTCSHDIVNLRRLLQAAVDDNSDLKINWDMGAQVLEHASYNVVGKALIFDFFLSNWSLIYARIENEFNMNSLNRLIRTCLSDSSHRSILELDYFINDESTNTYGVKSFGKQLIYLKTTRRWIGKNLKPLIDLFLQQLNKRL